MANPGFTPQYQKVGQIAASAVFGLGLLYAATTILGLLSIESAQDPIGDPFFTLMELLTIAIAPLMVATLVAVHAYARPETKAYSLMALIFMALMAGITSSVHFKILSVSRQIVAALPKAALLFSFRWPSVAYALGILMTRYAPNRVDPKDNHHGSYRFAANLEWFDQLQAPQKQRFVFENAAHSVAFEQFEALSQLMVDIILSETYPQL